MHFPLTNAIPSDIKSPTRSRLQRTHLLGFWRQTEGRGVWTPFICCAVSKCACADRYKNVTRLCLCTRHTQKKIHVFNLQSHDQQLVSWLHYLIKVNLLWTSDVWNSIETCGATTVDCWLPWLQEIAACRCFQILRGYLTSYDVGFGTLKLVQRLPLFLHGLK